MNDRFPRIKGVFGFMIYLKNVFTVFMVSVSSCWGIDADAAIDLNLLVAGAFVALTAADVFDVEEVVEDDDAALEANICLLSIYRFLCINDYTRPANQSPAHNEMSGFRVCNEWNKRTKFSFRCCFFCF